MPRGEPGNKDNHYTLKLSNLLCVLYCVYVIIIIIILHLLSPLIETYINIMYNYVIYPCNSHDFVSLS